MLVDVKSLKEDYKVSIVNLFLTYDLFVTHLYMIHNNIYIPIKIGWNVLGIRKDRIY